MDEYRHNKLKTILEIRSKIENWASVLDLRFHKEKKRLELIRFRNGLNIICRGGTRDWDVIHELLFAGGYGRAMQYLSTLPGEPTVLDLGGNIGLFSILAAFTNAKSQVFAYEPGPPNYRMFEMNRLANADLMDRIHLRKEAVSGINCISEWCFDDLNPGASGLFATKGEKFPVKTISFVEALASLPGPVALAKIDIEGAEFELLEKTPASAWKDVGAVSLELHDDPTGQFSRDAFLAKMAELGFKIVEETVVSYFFHR